jgi:hypothetical protein
MLLFSSLSCSSFEHGPLSLSGAAREGTIHR